MKSRHQPPPTTQKKYFLKRWRQQTGATNYQDNELFKFDSSWFHLLLLLMWLAIGTGLRFTNLAAKPPWNDEFATLVFSLGNSFRTVPLNQVITLDTLLMPLQPNPDADSGTVIHHLMTESSHPPIYFVLTHLWMQLFPTQGGLASFWAARSLSAILGAASIPAIFGLGWLAFRSRLVGQIAAAMIAVSPFGIYLAQEARHYTLAILLIIASLCCLLIATWTIHRRMPLPIWVGLIWVGVNSLGIAIHYFFLLTLATQALVLIALAARHKFNRVPATPSSPHWWRLYAVAVGTLIGGLIWLPYWQNSDNRVTQWIYNDSPLSNWLETITRVLAWIITMVSLLPVEGTTQPIMLAFGAVLVVFVFWTLPIFIRAIRIQLVSPPIIREPSHGLALMLLETQVLGGYVLAAIALVFGITYGLGADLTIAARYHFFYFPAVIVMLGAALAICWNASTLAARSDLGWTVRQQAILYFLEARGKKAVALILSMGFLGGLTVVSNFGYQKPDRPDLLVPIIQKISQVPILIATAHFTHEQTGEMMGLALEFKHHSSLAPATNSPLFLLAHLEPNSTTSIDTLEKSVTQLPHPLDLWIVNFFPTAQPEVKGCFIDTQSRPKMNGYKHRLYHCP